MPKNLVPTIWNALAMHTHTMQCRCNLIAEPGSTRPFASSLSLARAGGEYISRLLPEHRRCAGVVDAGRFSAAPQAAGTKSSVTETAKN
jgi:hypothetical protein